MLHNTFEVVKLYFRVNAGTCLVLFVHSITSILYVYESGCGFRDSVNDELQKIFGIESYVVCKMTDLHPLHEFDLGTVRWQCASLVDLIS